MIYADGKVFVLGTDHTEYIFRVTEELLLEHLHYGGETGLVKRDDFDAEGGGVYADGVRALSEKVSHGKGTTVNYQKGSETVCEDMLLELSSVGKGDFRDPSVLIEYGDGSRTSDFIYEGYELVSEPEGMTGLPTAVAAGDKDVSQLKVFLKEKVKPVKLVLVFTVYPHCDVICRRCVVVNTAAEETGETIKLHRLMSLQLDLEGDDYKLTTFNGGWAREMVKHDTPVSAGLVVNHTTSGVSSNRNQSFVMLTKLRTGEEYGEGYGFHLLYSGNHYEAAGVSSFYKTRFMSGIDPTDFCWLIGPGESFESPEAAMTFTAEGYRGISRHMHEFIRRHIVRGKYARELKPILLNSWEASYFNISESRLLGLAKKAKEVGIELFVMDDGWFKGRNSDKSSLGDWEADPKKLPDGIGHLAKKVQALGLKFGIWVEPEMVNEDSDLFRQHPDYAMTIPGRDNSLGRNQMVLDLTNPKVVEYVKSSMRKVFATPGIDYVKWDMNRMISDMYSKVLTPDRQGETAHRYVLGLYDIMKTLTAEFPEILFEGCASGGNRFDPGMLCYMPQIWASDDTDAMMRTGIQTGYSYGYPMSVLTAHVSGCPNHQTLRTTPLDTRFNVAMFGNLGYELNLCDIAGGELEEIKAQVQLYKEWREVLQTGDFYRVGNCGANSCGFNGRGLAESMGASGFASDAEKAWLCVTKDKSRAVAMIWNEMVQPNDFYRKLRTVGLKDNSIYHVYNIPRKLDIREFGDLINQVAPIHVKKDSLVQDVIAHFVKLDGETEDYKVPGRLLNNSGIKLTQAFGGTGQNAETRVFQDFASRVYFIEEVE